MNDFQTRRIQWLTTGPVLRTLRGTRRRILSLNWDDIALLMGHFHCSIEALDYRLWRGRRRKVVHPAKIREGETA